MKYKLLHPIFVLCPVILISGGCSSLNQSAMHETQQPVIYAIKNVNIITMTAKNQVLKNSTVVIRDKKILSVNESYPRKSQNH